jgi:hypothetical protein
VEDQSAPIPEERTSKLGVTGAIRNSSHSPGLSSVKRMEGCVTIIYIERDISRGCTGLDKENVNYKIVSSNSYLCCKGNVIDDCNIRSELGETPESKKSGSCR